MWPNFMIQFILSNSKNYFIRWIQSINFYNSFSTHRIGMKKSLKINQMLIYQIFNSKLLCSLFYKISSCSVRIFFHNSEHLFQNDSGTTEYSQTTFQQNRDSGKFDYLFETIWNDIPKIWEIFHILNQYLS
jgi:hypothetical protein